MEAGQVGARPSAGAAVGLFADQVVPPRRQSFLSASGPAGCGRVRRHAMVLTTVKVPLSLVKLHRPPPCWAELPTTGQSVSVVALSGLVLPL